MKFPPPLPTHTHTHTHTQAETTLINFTVTESGLEDQLLALVVNKERPDLEETKTQLIIQVRSDEVLRTTSDRVECPLAACLQMLVESLSTAAGLL